MNYFYKETNIIMITFVVGAIVGAILLGVISKIFDEYNLPVYLLVGFTFGGLLSVSLRKFYKLITR